MQFRKGVLRILRSIQMQLAAALARILPTQQEHAQPTNQPQLVSDQALEAWSELQCLAHRLDYQDLFDFYPDTVIFDGGKLFDAIEIHGISPDGNGAHNIENGDPVYFSIFVRAIEGGIECVGDFGQPKHAIEKANLLADQYGWKVFNHLTNRLM